MEFAIPQKEQPPVVVASPSMVTEIPVSKIFNGQRVTERRVTKHDRNGKVISDYILRLYVDHKMADMIDVPRDQNEEEDVAHNDIPTSTHLTPEQKKIAVLECHAAGMTVQQIYKKYHITYNLSNKIIAEHGNTN
jgi:hypothetical protein